MSDPSSVESFDPFRARVEQLIVLENAGSGRGHFSFEAQNIQNTAALDLTELDDTDRALLDLLTTSLEETIVLLDTEPKWLTDEFRLKIFATLNEIMKPGLTPMQKLFRAYLNNKFAVLIGQIQLYTSAQKRNDKRVLDYTAHEIREMARVFLPILKGGR